MKVRSAFGSVMFFANTENIERRVATIRATSTLMNEDEERWRVQHTPHRKGREGKDVARKLIRRYANF